MEQQDVQSYKDYIEQIDLQRYWLVLKRRWLPASALSLLCIGGALYLATRPEENYRARGQILIKGLDPAATLTGVPPELAAQENFGARGTEEVSIIATQQTVLTSNEVLNDAIEALALKDQEGIPLKPGVLKSRLVTEQVPETSIVEVTYESTNPEEAAAIVNALMDSYIEQNIESNRAEARAAREFVEEELPRAKDVVDRISQNLSTFRAQNDIVNLQEETAATVELLQDLENDVRSNRTQLATATSQVVTLQEQLGLTSSQAQELVKLSRAESVREVLNSLGEVQNQIAIQSASYTENHPIIANLRRQEQSLTALLNERSGDVIGRPYSEDVGDYEFSGVDENLTAALLQTEAQRGALEQSLRELEVSRNDYLQRSSALPALEREELRLVNDLAAAQEEYDLLLSTLQQVRLAENQTVGTAQIQERADVPAQPVDNQARNVKILFAGIVGGLLSGIALAFLLDLLDKNIKTTKDAEALIGTSPLGIIPKFKTPSGLPTNSSFPLKVGGVSPRIVTLTGMQPMISSAYQMLQANLSFMNSEYSARSLVISSSVPEEGKSEVCANLAVLLAQNGQRVLIVDADMRSPSQHHLWNTANRAGLSHVLVGESSLDEALQPLTENITLLSSGIVPANPFALVDSERMSTLLQQLTKSYDFVILDSPPLVGSADAAVLGKLADGVLLVVRPRHVDSSSLLAAKALLNRSGAKILGFVANGVDVNNEHNDYISLAGIYSSYPASIGAGSFPANPNTSQDSVPLSRF